MARQLGTGMRREGWAGDRQMGTGTRRERGVWG